MEVVWNGNVGSIKFTIWRPSSFIGLYGINSERVPEQVHNEIVYRWLRSEKGVLERSALARIKSLGIFIKAVDKRAAIFELSAGRG